MWQNGHIYEFNREVFRKNIRSNQTKVYKRIFYSFRTTIITDLENSALRRHGNPVLHGTPRVARRPKNKPI